MTVGPHACVMGHRVAYSRSPMLHGFWLRTLGLPGTYELVDISPADFPAFLRHLAANGFVGGNITKPHKLAAFELVDRREAAAQAIGAVNTVWYEDDRLVGGNTDVVGYLAHLDERAPGWDAAGGLAVVIGAGGAANAVVYGLLDRGLDVAVVNRTRGRAEQLAERFGPRVSTHDMHELEQLLPQTVVLTNATSLGAVGQPPLGIDIAGLRRNAVVYDIVYVPVETALLRAAAARGHRTADGLGMLIQQAVPAFAKWFGAVPPVTPQLRQLLAADIHARMAGS